MGFSIEILFEVTVMEWINMDKFIENIIRVLNGISWPATVLLLVCFFGHRIRKVGFKGAIIEFAEENKKQNIRKNSKIQQICGLDKINLQMGNCVKSIVFYDTRTLNIPHSRPIWKRCLLVYKPLGYGGWMRHILFYLSLLFIVVIIISTIRGGFDSPLQLLKALGFWVFFAVTFFTSATIIDDRFIKLFNNACMCNETPVAIKMKHFWKRLFLAYRPHNILGWISHFLYYLMYCFHAIMPIAIFQSSSVSQPNETYSPSYLLAGWFLWICIHFAIYCLAVIVDNEPEIVNIP